MSAFPSIFPNLNVVMCQGFLNARCQQNLIRLDGPLTSWSIQTQFGKDHSKKRGIHQFSTNFPALHVDGWMTLCQGFLDTGIHRHHGLTVIKFFFIFPSYVATRVVERVYFELPHSPTPGLSNKYFTTSGHVTTENTVTPTTVQSTCSPQNYVMFLKTHKTGSSTITNILNRYADWNNLTMLLPNDEPFYSFNWPNKFRLSYAKDNHGKMPNILANHARYSRKSMNVLFPRERTAYISILRDPVKQWESTFSYMSFPYILNIHKKKDPLDFFLKNPPSLQNIKKNARRFPSIYLIKNPLFFDLGLDYKYYENITFMRRAVKTIDQDFDLVLMMEHFDESMVLLKRRLCWSFDDVVFFKTNERLKKNKRRVLTPEHEDMIKTWNSADVALYDYFVDKFWKEIEKEGPDFYDDLQELRERKKYYFNLCIEKEAVTEAYTSVFVKGYEMRKNLTGHTKMFCERMLRNELVYQDYFKDQYIERINALEGETIENFDDQLEEAEVEIELGSSWTEDGSAYDYGLPTKSPRLPPSKVTLLKTRVQKEKEKKAREVKRKRPVKHKSNTAGSSKELGSGIVDETASGRPDLKNVRPASSAAKLGTKTSNNAKKDKSLQKGQGKTENKHTKVATEEAKTTAPTIPPKQTIAPDSLLQGTTTPSPTNPITLDNYQNERLTTLANQMSELEKTTAEITTDQTKPTTEPVILRAKHRQTTPESREVTTEELTTDFPNIVTKPERVSETEITMEPKTKAKKSYIRFTKEPIEGKLMESANKELKMDDPRRYDGKTIITKRRPRTAT